jgi:hypothetical protein
VLAIDGTLMTCKGIADVCLVLVRVEPYPDPTKPCLATIDIQTVKVKKKLPYLEFRLVRSNMNDQNKYKFVDKGIAWKGSKPDSDEFDFAGLDQGDTVARWRTGGKKSGDFNYEPDVVDALTGKKCKAGDPRIANDGG